MTQSNAVVRGRVAFEAEAWTEAYTPAGGRHGRPARRTISITATAAYLIGEDAAGVRPGARAHDRFSDAVSHCGPRVCYRSSSR
jgi:hypothetical protein